MSVLQSLKEDDAASNLLGSVEAIGSLLGRSSAVDAGAFHYFGESILGMVNIAVHVANSSQHTLKLKVRDGMQCTDDGVRKITTFYSHLFPSALTVERVQLEDTLAGSYRFPKDCEFPLHH